MLWASLQFATLAASSFRVQTARSALIQRPAPHFQYLIFTTQSHSQYSPRIPALLNQHFHSNHESLQASDSLPPEIIRLHTRLPDPAKLAKQYSRRHLDLPPYPQSLVSTRIVSIPQVQQYRCRPGARRDAGVSCLFESMTCTETSQWQTR